MRISDWSSDVCSSDLLALAWRQRRFDRQQFAADLRPCQTGDLPDLVLLFGASIAELVDATILVEIVDGDVDARDVLRRKQFIDDLVADLADQPFDCAYAGFACVESHDVAKCIDIHPEPAVLDAVFLYLLRPAVRSEELSFGNWFV